MRSSERALIGERHHPVLRPLTRGEDRLDVEKTTCKANLSSDSVLHTAVSYKSRVIANSMARTTHDQRLMNRPLTATTALLVVGRSSDEVSRQEPPRNM